MRRPILALAATAVALLAAAPPAGAAFGLNSMEIAFSNEDGTPATQAGSHPFAATTVFGVNWHEDPKYGQLPDEQFKDLRFRLPPGLAGSPLAAPHCSTADFLNNDPDAGRFESCPHVAAVGFVSAEILGPSHPPGSGGTNNPVYNLEPPPGVAAKLGFWIATVPVTVEVGLSEAPPYNVVGAMTNASQAARVFGSNLTLWGNPSDPAHDPYRGRCLGFPKAEDGGPTSLGICPTQAAPPLLTMPRSCSGPLITTYEATSWQSAAVDKGAVASAGMTGCSKLGFEPRVAVQPTTTLAETGTGLDVNVDIHDEGLISPLGIAQSDVQKTVLALPEGMTINPSVGDGLGVCTPDQLARETASSGPGVGCPNASKLGTLEVLTPLVEQRFEGSIFLAPQDDPMTTTPGAENPFDTLIALYFVIKNPELGAIVKVPVKIEPDPRTGRLLATLDDSPQIPFSHFNAHLRTGARAALISPPACGTHAARAIFTPRADPSAPLETLATFQVTGGVNGGACPPGGVPPFHPEFQAGAVNNHAGAFSPFNMRLIREDGEQNMTKFSSILPPGQVGSLAGVDKCPDIAVAIAKSKQGREEIASPSCPANSLIGHTLAGAGVGASLTYVKGYVYLGGPYKGAPLSVISITPAVAGPFDAGTVAIRLGLDLNPKTAEVEVDGAASDPIPHIIKGIVLKLRDLRVYVDRPNFTLNPTSCHKSSAKATLFGSYLDVINPADDVPVDLATRYQAANCLNLGFKPKLNLNLKGGTKRGGHPGLKALYKPRKGDANIEGLVVRLPRSAFLDQAHIRTICTRVQFAADTCPKAAQYGYIKAWTPLLEEPLQGPVWLRSSNHKLPDLVFDLHGLVDVEVATRIDSAKGGIRATVEDAPDAPLTKVELKMQGGKKGLIINSRNLCESTSKAKVQFSGHNGKQSTANPEMRADGCKKGRDMRGKGAHSGHRRRG